MILFRSNSWRYFAKHKRSTSSKCCARCFLRIRRLTIGIALSIASKYHLDIPPSFISRNCILVQNVCPLLRILSGSSLSSARVVRLAFLFLLFRGIKSHKFWLFSPNLTHFSPKYLHISEKSTTFALSFSLVTRR